MASVLDNPRFTKTVVITRRSAGERVGGKLVHGPSITINIRASVQPISTRDMIQESAGRRATDSIKLFTKSEIKTTDDTHGTPADIVTVDGVQYEIQQVERWDHFGIAHFKGIAARVNNQ